MDIGLHAKLDLILSVLASMASSNEEQREAFVKQLQEDLDHRVEVYREKFATESKEE